MKKSLSIFFLILGLFFLINPQFNVSAADMVTICHAAGQSDTTKYVTLTISENAVYGRHGQAGHFNEDGTVRAGHENDTFGACENPTLVAVCTDPTANNSDDNFDQATEYEDNSICTYDNDLCINILGNQTEIPTNYYETNGDCFAKTPVCGDETANNYVSDPSSTQYESNEVCTYSTHRWCHWNGEGYTAMAVANNDNSHAEDKLDKAWETGMDRYCVVAPTNTPTPTPTPMPGKTSVLGYDISCNEGDFVATFDLKENGVATTNVVVSFTYNGLTKQDTTNQDGRARVTFPQQGSYDLKATPENSYPAQTMKVYMPENCAAGEPTATPGVGGLVLGASTESTGQVLGVSTMANTGMVEDLMALSSIASGILLLGHAHKKKN